MHSLRSFATPLALGSAQSYIRQRMRRSLLGVSYYLATTTRVREPRINIQTLRSVRSNNVTLHASSSDATPNIHDCQSTMASQPTTLALRATTLLSSALLTGLSIAALSYSGLAFKRLVEWFPQDKYVWYGASGIPGMCICTRSMLQCGRGCTLMIYFQALTHRSSPTPRPQTTTW
jgi:hypothetical protein